MTSKSTAVPRFDAKAPGLLSFIRNLSTPWKCAFFFDKVAFLLVLGRSVREVTPNRCQVTIPTVGGRRIPSDTYFAALVSAAELSTGGSWR